MSYSDNIANNPSVNAAQNHADSILPEGFDAKSLKDFFTGLLDNAKPGDRDALQALLKDLDGFANISESNWGKIGFGSKLLKGGIFGIVGGPTRENINQDLVPFLEALANNPGAFGKDVPPNMSLDQTMDFIVKNAPPHLQPLLKDMAQDIKGFTRNHSEEGRAIGNLMAYLVNKGNENTAANPAGSAIGGVGNDSPGGVGPGNIVDNGSTQTADTSATLGKTSAALRLVSEIIADPSKLTPENIQKLAKYTADIISDIAAAGGDTKKAEMVAKQIAALGSGDVADATTVQGSLISLVQSLTQQLLDEFKKGGKSGNSGGGAPKGAPGAPAAAAPGGNAGGGEGTGEVGGSEGAGEVGGSEGSGSTGSGGLSIFEVIAKALGDKMTAKLKEMRGFANEISSLSSGSGAGDPGNSEKIAGLSAQLGAASQEFSLISNSFSTTIKALGEGTKAAVRYS